MHAQLEGLVADELAARLELGTLYQPVRLRSGRTFDGIRAPSTRYLDRLDLRAARVLDLGSNVGQLARAVRAQGAAAVDGYEGDAGNVVLANLLNAHFGTTRVSFFHVDIADPATFGERYDVIMAYSVLSHLQHTLPIIATLAPFLVLETHRLHDDLDDHRARLEALYGAVELIGFSEWQSGAADRRAVFACARSRADLDRVLLRAADGTATAQAGGPAETADTTA